MIEPELAGEKRPLGYDPKRACPKCAGTDTWTHYEASSHAFSCRDHVVRQDHDAKDRFSCASCGDEHFDRGCRTCSYAWREEVLT